MQLVWRHTMEPTRRFDAPFEKSDIGTAVVVNGNRLVAVIIKVPHQHDRHPQKKPNSGYRLFESVSTTECTTTTKSRGLLITPAMAD